MQTANVRHIRQGCPVLCRNRRDYGTTDQDAKEHNMIVVGIYADEGKTARKELKKRKAIHALLEDVKAGKIDMILF